MASLGGDPDGNGADSAVDAILKEARTRVQTMHDLQTTVVTAHSIPSIENTSDLLLVQRVRDLQNKE